MKIKITGYLPCTPRTISRDGNTCEVYELKDIELFNGSHKPHSVRVVTVEPGMKIYPTDNSENGCNKIAKELEGAGFKTRIGYNKDCSRWSIAVLDNEEDNNYEI